MPRVLIFLPVKSLARLTGAQRGAAKPSAVRPACSAAHFSIKARLAGPALAGSVAISILFVTGRDLVLEMGTPPYRALLIRKG